MRHSFSFIDKIFAHWFAQVKKSMSDFSSYLCIISPHKNNYCEHPLSSIPFHIPITVSSNFLVIRDPRIDRIKLNEQKIMADRKDQNPAYCSTSEGLLNA